jgi:hypothetical protein
MMINKIVILVKLLGEYSPKLHKLISFLFSIPRSNAYVEGVFSTMKHLYDDQQDRNPSEITW